MLSDDQKTVSKIIASNQFGTFFGVPQEVLDGVWEQLRAPQGNSVVYVTMEIGADRDVFHPVKAKLDQLEVSAAVQPELAEYINAFQNGPVKIPNYGGGLGILAGDTLKSFADCKIPVLAVTLLYRHGYFAQMVDFNLGQVAWSKKWEPEKTPSLYLLKNPEDPDSPLEIEVPFYDDNDREQWARARVWLKMEINSTLDFFVPEILLDYHAPSSPEWIQEASSHLYDSSSEKTKAIQRRLLGAGVLPVMKALGVTSKTIHLNEQHGVSVVLDLISEDLHATLGENFRQTATEKDIESAARKAAERIVYTIHTPVKAGHDRFSKTIFHDISHSFTRKILDLLAVDADNPAVYNFTALAMRINRTTNSVSRLHREVTRRQFPQYAEKITAITNGVHHLTWISDAKKEVYDSFAELYNWRQDPSVFANAGQLLRNNRFRTYLEQGWAEDTRALVAYINRMLLKHRNQRLETWIDPPNYLSYLKEKDGRLDPDVFTIGFARRFSTYKRADLIFEDIDRLADIVVSSERPINFIYAGKAHPADEPGKDLIKTILDVQDEVYHKSNGLVKLVFIPGYDMAIAKMMVAGVHAWLNSPKRPLEASGTSGMKAAMNGIPNISIMDGWWVEGYHDGQTGWKFGYDAPVDPEHLSEHPSALLYEEDSAAFYALLPEILETFYSPGLRSQYIDKCVMNLTLNCPIFNTHRMAAEYLERYRLALPASVERQMKKFRKLYSSNQESGF